MLCSYSHHFFLKFHDSAAALMLRTFACWPLNSSGLSMTGWWLRKKPYEKCYCSQLGWFQIYGKIKDVPVTTNQMMSGAFLQHGDHEIDNFRPLSWLTILFMVSTSSRFYQNWRYLPYKAYFSGLRGYPHNMWPKIWYIAVATHLLDPGQISHW